MRTDQYACVCPKEFSGPRCESATAGTGEFPVYLLVILLVTAALIVFIVAAGLMICAIARGKQERQHAAYQPQESIFPEQNITAWHSVYDTNLKVQDNFYM